MFPNYKKKWKWFIETTDGWVDLGPTGTHYYCAIRYNEKIHNFCGKTLSVGKENNEVFLFCPRCMVKVS